MKDYIPTLQEVAAANKRLTDYMNTTFGIGINGWRMVWLRHPQIFYNRVAPELTIIHYRPEIVVATPYMPNIDGWLAISVFSIPNARCTWLLPGGASVTVAFRCCNTRSEAWLREKLALASGMRFRSHGFVDKEKIVYTRDA